MINKIKSLHPKNHVDLKDFIYSIFCLFFLVFMFFIPTEWTDGAEVFKLPDRKIYTVFYRYGRGSVGPYLYVKNKDVGYMLLCYQPKSTREQIKEICHKENRDFQFAGKNVVIYKDKITGKSLIRQAIFIQSDCKENCKSTFIRTPLSDIENFIDRFRYIKAFYLCASLFFGGYLILQIKYRFLT